MNTTSDGALVRQLTWLPSAAPGSRVDISGSFSPEAPLAHSWDSRLTQPARRDSQRKPEMPFGASWSHRTWAVLLSPHPPPPDKPHLDSQGRKENSSCYLIFGNPLEDHSLLWGHLHLWLCWTHTPTQTQLFTMVVQAAVAPSRPQRLLLKIPYGSLRRCSVERVSYMAAGVPLGDCSKERDT
jgi:hypothetical protein